jgi:PAS domain S-box-containing protein
MHLSEHERLFREARPVDRRITFGDDTRVLFASVGLDGRMKFLNSAWAKVLGYADEELRNRPLRELLAVRVPAAAALATRVLNPAEPDPLEFCLQCKDGTHKLFTWHRRFDPETQRMYIAGEEIPDRRRTAQRAESRTA